MNYLTNKELLDVVGTGLKITSTVTSNKKQKLVCESCGKKHLTNKLIVEGNKGVIGIGKDCLQKYLEYIKTDIDTKVINIGDHQLIMTTYTSNISPTLYSYKLLVDYIESGWPSNKVHLTLDEMMTQTELINWIETSTNQSLILK
jgi:hypothetical protein